MDENRESCRAINGLDSNTNHNSNNNDININNNNNNLNNNDPNNNNLNNNIEGHESQRVMQPQDVHTRERLFDFIALLQGRRMDDQRAILKPSNTT